MGLPGAAMAKLVAQALGVALNFLALYRGVSRLQFTLKGYRVDIALMWRLAKIGTPAAVTGMQRALSQLIVLGIAAPFGDGVVAAFALSRRAERTWSTPAAGALAGQNLGVGRRAGAKSTVKWALV